MSSDDLTNASSLATVAGTVIALVSAIASAVSARASKRDAKESRRALALHFAPQLLLEVSDKSLGVSDAAERLDFARQAQIGQNLQLLVRHAGGAHPLRDDEVQIRWVTRDGRPRDRVVIVPMPPVVRAEASLLELSGLAISGYSQDGYPQVKDLRRVEIRTRDSQTGSDWLAIYEYQDLRGFYDGIFLDCQLVKVR